MELRKPSTLLSSSPLNTNNNGSNPGSNPTNGASTSNQKVPGGPSLMMGAAHGGIDAKLSTTAAVGFTSAPSDEKGVANAGGFNG
jgi:hypothetical protein